MLPDLGYPFTWDYREWDSGTMTHNTVTVDETSGEYNIGGQANLMASAEGVHVVCARHDPYPSTVAATADKAPARGVTRYERTDVMVDLPGNGCYVVDLFAVNGGSQHDQSWHGPLKPVVLPPLPWKEQATGTLAGEQVAHGAKHTDRWGRTGTHVPCYLSRIRRADLAEPAVLSWDYGLPEGDRLNLHLIPVGAPAQLVAGTGRSPARPADWGLDYVFVRREARGETPNYFLSVLDPFQKSPGVERVCLVSSDPLTVEVKRSDGALDTIVFSTPPGASRTTEHRELGVLYRSEAPGGAVREVAVGSVGAPRAGAGYARATVKSVDWAANEITVPYQPGLENDFLPGRYLRLYNGERSAMYRLLKASREGGSLRLTLDSTALLAQGPIAKTEDGALYLGDELVFANGRADDKGTLLPGNDYFAGAYVSDGKHIQQLRGAVRNAQTKLYLREAVAVAELQKTFGGKAVSIWQYGAGDSVEIARVR